MAGTCGCSADVTGISVEPSSLEAWPPDSNRSRRRSRDMAEDSLLLGERLYMLCSEAGFVSQGRLQSAEEKLAHVLSV